MSDFFSALLSAAAAFSILLAAACAPAAPEQQTPAAPSNRAIRVAQSGEADVIGADDKALQKAADLLKPGDSLIIGPGTYRMENSLFIPCSNVVVQGAPGLTVLKKGPGLASRVLDGGDYGEDVLVLENPGNFHPGMGITVLDDQQNGDWSVTVTTVKEIRGDTIYLVDRTLRDYNYETANARVEGKFPILCAIGVEGVTFEGLTVDGNKAENPYFLDGCRGGAIYLYQVKNCVIRNCVSRNYNGDGISFQITDNVKVIGCESYGHTNYGAHPGTGSPHFEIRDCKLHDNGVVGLFLCWRARFGRVENNLLENNGMYGISIGHKDTDNLFLNNTIRNNGFCGVFFRPESEKLSGHRNKFQDNQILDNGDSKRGYGVYAEPHAHDLTFTHNTIQDTRPEKDRTQRYGIYICKGAGPVEQMDNAMSGHLAGDYFDQNKK